MDMVDPEDGDDQDMDMVAQEVGADLEDMDDHEVGDVLEDGDEDMDEDMVDMDMVDGVEDMADMDMVDTVVMAAMAAGVVDMDTIRNCQS